MHIQLHRRGLLASASGQNLHSRSKMVTKIDDDRTIAITTFLQGVSQATLELSFLFGLRQPAAAFPSTACCGRSACGTTVNLLSWQQAANEQSGSGLPQSKRGIHAMISWIGSP